jgi:hypothetical protein
MDLQLRKIHFIQEFLRLNNEKVIARLEKALDTEKHKLYEKNLSPYTIEELEEMISESESELENKKYISTKQLKKDIQQWR